MSFQPPSVNYTYKTPLSSSELTQRNKNRMIYANYITKIQDNNVGCDTARTGLENGQVAPGSIIPDLIEGARYTTQEERDRILATSACQFPLPPVAPVVVPPFNPTSYGNLQLWLDAADVTGTGTNPSDGSIVTTWVDKSGAGGNGTKIGDPTLASTGLNGKPGILLNGTSMGYRGALTNSGTVVTTFAVATLNAAALQYGRLVSLAGSTGNDTGTALSGIPFFRDNATPQNIAGYRNGAKLSTQPTPAYDTAFYATSIFDGTNNTTYVNGVAGTSASSSGTFGVTKYGIGRPPNDPIDQDYWKGYVSEVLIYNSALSTSDRQAVETYLKEKWGIA